MQGQTSFAPHGAVTGPLVEPAAGLRAPYRAIAASCVGNLLEWYDFAIYTFFATTIAAQLFPPGNDRTALLSAFLVFGISFVARPLGGLLIGLFGDRRGRKPALLLTIGMMAIGTALIGIIPPYATIGVMAPVLLVVARILQGLSAGGEWGGSLTFLIEWAPKGRRGLFGGLHETSAVLGPLIASAMAAGAASLLPAHSAETWGWRIPFLLGGLLGPIGLLLRRNIEETPVFRSAEQGDDTAPGLSTGAILLLGGRAFAVVAVIYATFYTLFYMSTFLTRYAGLDHEEALWSSTIATLVLALTVPIAAMLSDRIGRKPLMLGACLALAVFSYPLFSLLIKGVSFETALVVQILFAIVTGIFSGPFPAAIAEQFPTRLRLTMPGVAYSLAGILFGGFNSFISTWLIERTGSSVAVCYLTIVAAVISAVGVAASRETFKDSM